MRTGTDFMKFLRRKILGAFTDEVRDHNILNNLDILNINKDTADRKMNAL